MRVTRVLFGLVGLVGIASLPFVTFAEIGPCPHQWNNNLKVGSTGDDVLALQRFLNTNGFTVAAAGAGSPGKETMRFGELTKRAVAAFQEKYARDILVPNGLAFGTGIAGVSTRGKLNALCNAALAASSAPAAPPEAPAQYAATTTASSLAVTIPSQPAATLAAQSALYVPFTNVSLTAGSSDVTVRGVTIERVGPSSDQIFSDADLLDQDGNVVSTAYFAADHKTTFKDEFTVPARTTQTFSVVGDMADDLSGHQGEIAGLQIDSIDADAPVVGSLPLQGTEQIANSSLVISTASAYRSSFDPNGERTNYINDTGVIFSGIRVTAGIEEDLRLDSITWRQSGTASSADLANVVTIVNGTSYPMTEDDRSYTAVFPGITIAKGQSVDIYARGDLLIGGANRSVELDIQFPTDVHLTGKTYGYGIYLVPGGNAATEGNSVFLTDDGSSTGVIQTPFYVGSVTHISGGAVLDIGRQ